MQMNKKKHRFINGQKGFISLLLIIVMLPFYGVAAILEETARYQASFKAMDEAGNLAAVSTLAAKDEFLYKRFGLLALDQSSKTTIDKTYLKYLKSQKTQGTSSFNVRDSDVSVSGVYSLGDIYTLEQEVMQYGAVRMPVSIVKDLASVDKIIKDLEEKMGISGILQIIDTGAKVVDAAVKIENAAVTINDKVDELSDAYSDYTTAFDDWNTKLTDYKTYVESMPETPEEPTISDNDEDYKNEDGSQMSSDEIAAEKQKIQDDYDTKKKAADDAAAERKTKAEAVNTARNTYGDKTKALADALNEVDKATDTAIQELGGFVKNTDSLVVACYNEDLNTYNQIQNRNIDNAASKLSKENPEDSEAIGEVAAGVKDETKTAVSNVQAVEKELNDTSGNSVDTAKNTLHEYKHEIDRIMNTLLGQKDATVGNETKNITGKPDIGEDNDWEAYDLSKVDFNQEAEKYTHAAYIEDLLIKKGVEAALTYVIEYLKNLVNCITHLTKMDFLYDPQLDVTIENGFFDSLPSQNPGREFDNNPYAEEDKAAAIANIKAYTGSDYENLPFDNDYNLFETALDDFLDARDQFTSSIRDLNILSLTPWQLIQTVADISTVQMNEKGQPVNKQYRYLSDIAKVYVSCHYLVFSIRQLQTALSQFTSVGDFLSTMAKNLARREIVMAYLCYNLSNRTNYTSYIDKGGTAQANNDPFLTYIRTRYPVGTMVFQDLTGVGRHEKAFAGCELEYICFGDQSEVKNQTRMAGMLYAIRLIADIVAIATNSEFLNIFDTLAAIFPVGSIISLAYLLLVVVGEPAIDVLFLVNGEKIPLYKGTIYLTPSGIPKFITTWAGLSISKAAKTAAVQAEYDALNASLNTLNGQDPTSNSDVTSAASSASANVIALEPPKEEGTDVLKFNYMQYAFVIMSLAGNKKKYMQRLQDIIVMEANQNFTKTQTYQQAYYGQPDSFDIDKAYTCLRVKTSGSFKPVLPVPTISAGGVLKYESVNYRGY